MYDVQPCGRPIYPAPAGVDEKPVCLMHSHDPNKDDAAFQAEFERILREAGDGLADFSQFVFPAARYEGRTFKAKCMFFGATFAGLANFLGATFLRDASFAGAKFLDVAVFGMAKFERMAHFSHAIFSGAADIRFGTFEKDVDFVGTEFMDTAEFDERSFKKTVSFEEASFHGAVNFHKTVFRKDKELYAGPVFMNARFQMPDRVLFYKTYLGQALFHNCGVSKFVFRDVDWRLRKNGKSKVFEEDVAFYSRVTKPLEPEKGVADERNYRLIGELYHELKKNYDDRHDYWTAGDFHWGEMEMKRRHSPRRNKVLRWSHRHLGLVAWYNYASDYGESYVKPLAWILIVLLLFALAYPACGLRRAAAGSRIESKGAATADLWMGGTDEITYANFFQFASASSAGAWSAGANFVGQSLWTSVGAAALQWGFAEYMPATMAGRVVSLFEFLLTSTLVALVLLAVRRQFRR
jgi:uncharacterized protein YjbI with pentapeptide repeats